MSVWELITNLVEELERTDQKALELLQQQSGEDDLAELIEAVLADAHNQAHYTTDYSTKQGEMVGAGAMMEMGAGLERLHQEEGWDVCEGMADEQRRVAEGDGGEPCAPAQPKLAPLATVLMARVRALPRPRQQQQQPDAYWGAPPAGFTWGLAF